MDDSHKHNSKQKKPDPKHESIHKKKKKTDKINVFH